MGRPPQLQSWIRWTQAHLYSHFLVWIEHPLLHHNYYIQSSSWLTAEPCQGFYCRAVPIFMKFLQRVCAAQGLIWGPTFIKHPRIVVLVARDISRSPDLLVVTVKHLINGSHLLTDCEWGQSLQLCRCSCLWLQSLQLMWHGSLLLS